MRKTEIEKRPSGGQVGNQSSAKHSLYSNAPPVVIRRSRRAQQRVRTARKDYPWLDDKRWIPTLKRWAYLSLIFEDMAAHIAEVGWWSEMKDQDMTPRRMLPELRGMNSEIVKLEDRLGINYAAARAFALDKHNGPNGQSLNDWIEANTNDDKDEDTDEA